MCEPEGPAYCAPVPMTLVSARWYRWNRERSVDDWTKLPPPPVGAGSQCRGSINGGPALDLYVSNFLLGIRKRPLALILRNWRSRTPVTPAPTERSDALQIHPGRTDDPINAVEQSVDRSV